MAYVWPMQQTKLGKYLAFYQNEFSLSGKELANEIGIGESNLTRLKRGKMPDVHGLIKVLAWLATEWKQ